jgi:hypothetical protein
MFELQCQVIFSENLLLCIKNLCSMLVNSLRQRTSKPPKCAARRLNIF